MNDSERRVRFLVLLLVVVTLGFAFAGGTPFYHPDCLLQNTINTIQDRWHPQQFNYPALVLYILALTYRVTASVAVFLGVVPTVPDFFSKWRPWLEEPGVFSFALPGHTVIVLFSLLGVIATSRIAYRLTGSHLAGCISGLILCTDPLWVQNAHFITVDIPLSALSVATVCATLTFNSRRTSSWHYALLLGLLVGLTASAKYNGALVCIVPAVGLVLNSDCWRAKCAKLAICGLSASAAFGLTNPFIALDWSGFKNGFLFELRHASQGHIGFQAAGHAWGYHLRETLPCALGMPLGVLCLLGIAAMVISGMVSVRDRIITLSFPVIFFAFMGSSVLTFHRYMLPLLPFAAIACGVAFGALMTWVSARLRGLPRMIFSGAILVSILVVITPNVRDSAFHNRLLLGEDTRASFLRLLKHLPIGEQPVRIHATGHGKLVLYFMSHKESITLCDANESPDLVVIDSFSADRWFRDPLASHQWLPVPPDARAVFSITPFTRAKEQVPYAPQSLYSPSRPDLCYRLAAGPYIEIYVRNVGLVDRFRAVAKSQQIAVTEALPESGFYARAGGRFSRGVTLPGRPQLR